MSFVAQAVKTFCFIGLSILLLLTVVNADGKKQYVVGSSWGNTECSHAAISKNARLCNTCQRINETRSVTVKCQVYPYPTNCEQDTFENQYCEGNPASREIVPCGGQCREYNISSKIMSGIGQIVDENIVLRELQFPVVKEYATGNCAGDVYAYLEFGGCKPKGKKNSQAQICKNDGNIYTCLYSDANCQTENKCFQLKKNPGQCNVKGATFSQEWVCSV